jgi:hypothetical protein
MRWSFHGFPGWKWESISHDSNQETFLDLTNRPFIYNVFSSIDSMSFWPGVSFQNYYWDSSVLFWIPENTVSLSCVTWQHEEGRNCSKLLLYLMSQKYEVFRSKLQSVYDPLRHKVDKMLPTNNNYGRNYMHSGPQLIQNSLSIIHFSRQKCNFRCLKNIFEYLVFKFLNF